LSSSWRDSRQSRCVPSRRSYLAQPLAVLPALPLRSRLSRMECSVADAFQDRDASIPIIRRHDVEFSIAVQVADGDAVVPGRSLEFFRLGELPLTVIQKHGEKILGPMRRDEIDIAVGIEIGD